MSEQVNDTVHIYSPLSEDEDLREIVALFVSEMPDRIAKLEAECAAGNWSDLERTAHQLKGAAGSYGFSRLTLAASTVEFLCRDRATHDEIAHAVKSLVLLCRCITSKPQKP